MKYIISRDDSIEINGFITLSSMQELEKEDLDSKSSIVVHSFIEDDYNGSLILTSIVEKFSIVNVLYINNNPSPNMLAFIQSISGNIETDEIYLRDEEELNTILRYTSNELAVIEEEPETDASVLYELIFDLENGSEEKVFSKPFIGVLNRLATQLASTKEQDDQSIKDLRNLVKETYIKTKAEIDKINKRSEEVSKVLDSLNSNQASQSKSVSSYPPINYFGSQKLLLFKEYTSCRYLTTYVLELATYLSRVKHLRVKVIIVAQANGTNSIRYKGIKEVTLANFKNANIITADVTYTTSPTKTLLDYQIGSTNNVVLVLDRTYSIENIVKGKVQVINCISGRSEIDSFNLDLKNTLTSTFKLPNSLSAIPHIKGFPTKPLERTQYLQKAHADSFREIFKKYIGGKR